MSKEYYIQDTFTQTILQTHYIILRFDANRKRLHALIGIITTVQILGQIQKTNFEQQLKLRLFLSTLIGQWPVLSMTYTYKFLPKLTNLQEPIL